MDAALFAALAEPNRLRIVELLDRSPRSVGEVAMDLGLRQPQTTKHLQTLERAGVVTMHPLGQRRIYSLRREAFVELRRWLDGLARAHPSEPVLARYERAVERETALAAGDPRWAAGRIVRFSREIPAPVALVWSYWTTAAHVARWWAPEHFAVAEAVLDPSVGGRLRIVLEESDGARHDSVGRFLLVDEPRRLRFELTPLTADREPLFTAVYDVALERRAEHTELALEIEITDARPEAAPAIAGIELGWGQLLDKLAAVLTPRSRTPR